MKSFLNNYKWSVFLRFWAQSYLELGIGALLGLQNFSNDNSTQISNTVICLVTFIYICISPWLFLKFSYKNLTKIVKKEKSFVNHFSSLFYEFKNDNGFISTQFYFIFTIRRLVYMLNLTLLNNRPSSQICINCVLSTISVLYLAKYKPYEDKIHQISNLFSEIGILLFMALISINMFDISTNLRDSFESVMVLIISAVLISQLVASVAIFVRTCHQIIKLGLNHMNKKDGMKHQLNSVRSGITKVANLDCRPEIDTFTIAMHTSNDYMVDMTNDDVID